MTALKFRAAAFGDTAIGWLLVLLQIALIPASGLMVQIPGPPSLRACVAILRPDASPVSGHPSDGAS